MPLPITKQKKEFFSPPENIGYEDVARCFLFLYPDIPPPDNLFYAFFPQHFLYFLPLPQGQ
jgi:hypothetical protein